MDALPHPFPPPRPDDADELLAQAAWARRLARTLVRDPGGADDVAQEAWVSALSGAPRRGGGARAWFARVVRNQAAMRHRTETARAGRERHAARSEASLPPPDEVLQRVEAQRALVDEVLALAPPYRDAILLRFFEELSAADIASRQGVPAGTVRARLSRGLAELRARLERRDATRGTGMPALAVLAAGLPERTGPVAVLAGLLTGGTLVTTAAKLGAAAAAMLVAAGVGIAVLQSPENEATAGERTAAAPLVDSTPSLSSQKTDPPNDGASLATGTAGAPADRQVAATRQSATRFGVDSPTAAESSPSGTRVLARFVDERGVPVTNAVLSWREYAVQSDARGEVALEIPEETTPEGERTTLSYSAPRFATGRIEATIRRDETTHLGTVALRPGSVLAGFVVDEEGQPVIFASVWTGQVELREELIGLHRRRGETLMPFGLFDEAPLRLDTSTGVQGEFELAGVGAGEVRLWAVAGGTGHAWTEVLHVAPGEDQLDLRLVLPARSEADWIRGYVLDPHGAPVPRARVSWSYSTPGLGGGSEVRADERGRFELLAWADVSHELRAIDPEERHADSATALASPGTHDVVLDLQPTPPDGLLRDSDGRLVRRTLRVLDESGAGVSPYLLTIAGGREEPREVNDSDGRAEIAVPAGAFRIEIAAEGFEPHSTELLDPAHVPDETVVRLSVTGGVRGRVLADGAPVEGALVELARRADPTRYHSCGGLPSWLECGAERRTRTAPDGTFALPITQNGSYSVLVTANHRALLEVGPLELRPGEAMGLGDLRMGLGGRLEVRVVAPAGASPAGRVVVASRGDGHPRVGRADAEGRVTFGGLTPGRWDVTTRDQEGEPSFWDDLSERILRGEEPLQVPWVVEVVEGRVARYELEVE